MCDVVWNLFSCVLTFRLEYGDACTPFEVLDANLQMFTWLPVTFLTVSVTVGVYLRMGCLARKAQQEIKNQIKNISTNTPGQTNVSKRTGKSSWRATTNLLMVIGIYAITTTGKNNASTSIQNKVSFGFLKKKYEKKFHKKVLAQETGVSTPLGYLMAYYLTRDNFSSASKVIRHVALWGAGVRDSFFQQSNCSYYSSHKQNGHLFK